MSLGVCILVRLKALSQGVLQITRDNQDSVLFMIFRQPKISIFIRRHWQSAFVIYPTIQYPRHTEPDLHHDVAVHPKSHSLLVRPLGLTAGEMYSVGEIYIKTPLTRPSLRVIYAVDPASFHCGPAGPPGLQGQVTLFQIVFLFLPPHHWWLQAPRCLLRL